MKAMFRKLLTTVLLFSLICECVSLSMSKQASAKAVSEVTKVFTLTSKKSVKHRLSISKKEEVLVKIEFLEVKGKVSLSSGEELYLGDYECEDGKGSFFSEWSKPDKLKKTSFKKGNILKSEEDYITGKSEVEWYLPSGLKKLKVRVTYYTKSGAKGIKSIK